MAEIHNLAGVATKDLVDNIGTGRFQASYINWARTMNLLHQYAPGWMVDYEPAPEGGLLHRAPVGGYLLIRFRHVDGTVTPSLPQAVMDHKNNSIACDKISSRDISDTQRRGMCMAAAMIFGLGYELWAKMPLEEAYSRGEVVEAPKAPKLAPTTTAAPVVAADAKASEEVTEDMFREAALEKGVQTVAIDALVEIVKAKLGGDFAKGLKTLGKKSADELNEQYIPVSNEESEQW